MDEAPETVRRWRAGSIGLAPVGDDVAEARRHLGSAALDGPAQEEVRREMLDFTHGHPDCLHRSCGPGHLTASAVVFDPSTAHVLLIHHAKLGRWLQPGGHADGEGNLALVAWKEATEETGLEDLVLVTPAIDVDIHPIGARGADPAHHHLDLRFLALVGPDRRPVPNHETLGARWAGADDEVVTGGELARLVARAVALGRALTTGP